MLGLMMQTSLLLSSILMHAARSFPDVEIVSRTPDKLDHITSYSGLLQRSSQFANALKSIDIKPGDRVATLAWNSYRHLELYFGISGMGAVCHTINPRLFVEQIIYVINHAEDVVVFFDLTFIELVHSLVPQCPTVEAWIYLGEVGDGKIVGAKGFTSYEEFLSVCSEAYAWPEFDENTACGLCYTSGTTGNPKGVLCSHRSAVLHSCVAALPDACRISLDDTVALVSPMFHAMSWGIPYCATAMGSKLVMPGQKVDGESLHRLFEDHGVTFASGVPSVWLGYVRYLQSANVRPTTLDRVMIGGTACPSSLMEALQDNYGVEVLHGWGMTETGPIATISKSLRKHRASSRAERRSRQIKQGRAVFGVEIDIRDRNNRELPHDGKTFGDLVIRGLWIASAYYKMPESERADGWFLTGDVATIDSDGYMQVTDRSKDVIKSGGEWISSIELENLAMTHPKIVEAAVIGIAHPKWDERPLVLAVRSKGSKLTAQDLLTFYEGKIAKWWMPDGVLFVNELPHGATGKILKNKLRELYGNQDLAAIGRNKRPERHRGARANDVNLQRS
jgi:acyl-CoA synthetase (AMP-forming)/AMP-acid ligase II